MNRKIAIIALVAALHSGAIRQPGIVHALDAPVIAPMPQWSGASYIGVWWNAVTSATAYYLEWSKNASFSPPVRNSGWIAQTGFYAEFISEGTHWFRVKSRDSFLTESAWSNSTSCTQDCSPRTPPGTPIDEGTTWPGLSVRFFWTPASDTASGIKRYEIDVGTSPGQYDVVMGLPVGNVLNWAVSGKEGKTLYARVRAIDNAYNIGPWSGNSDGIKIQSTGAHTTISSPLQYYGVGKLKRAVYSPDGNYFLTCGSAGAFLWDIYSGSIVRMYYGHKGGVNCAAFSPDGTKVATGSDDMTVKVWSASTGALLYDFSGHNAPVTSVAFSPNGKMLLSGSQDMTARLWNEEYGVCFRTFSGHTAAVTSVAFSPEGTKVLTGSEDATAKLWEASTAAEVLTFTGHTAAISSVAFSPDGKIVLTGSMDSSAKMWDLSNGALIRTFRPQYHIRSVAFSPDGTRVLTGGEDASAKLWDAFTGSYIRSVTHGYGHVFSAIFSPDGRKIITAGPTIHMDVKMWNSSNGALLRTYSGHTWPVWPVDVSPNGEKVLSGYRDINVARLWQANDGSLLHTLYG
ncbi:MAG: WD40 repeat domain-containing protein, partial [Candidatus Sumerlaeia bacterium]|nr:WD40 repeat domain-containing protein [Candidatus Sumerlaeia bacterium]